MKEYSVEDSLRAWEGNAEFWDETMGDASNDFHRQVVRPGVNQLLAPGPEDFVLDIACGNGNYSAYLAQQGARVVAFDYSPKMVALARKRRAQYRDRVEFLVADATNPEQLLTLRRERPYTKAVSNMAVMDIADVRPLFQCVYDLLEENGVFVFATQHPCFVTLTDRYLTPHSYLDIALEGQPLKQCYYHRSLQDIFQICFSSGFVIDGFLEESFRQKETPDVIIVRARKEKKR